VPDEPAHYNYVRTVAGGALPVLQKLLPLYGALYAASIYGKRFEMGARQVGGMKLYVSRGIGMEGKGAPRVRFLCPPEVTLFEISPQGGD
jgi:predicted MPP superfamily phosphohydrolase